MYKRMIMTAGMILCYTSCACGMSGRLITTLKTPTLSKQQMVVLNHRYLSQRSSIFDYAPVRLATTFMAVSALTLGATSAITYGLDIVLDTKNREKACTGKPGCAHKCTQNVAMNEESEAELSKKHNH